MVASFAKFVFEQMRKTVERPTRLLTVPAQILLQNDHPALAWLCLRQLLRFTRLSTDESLLAANCLYQGLGRFRDAMELLEKANQESLKETARIGLAEMPIRVLDSVWARHIGHLGVLDYVLKLGILEGRRREDVVFYVSSGSRVANRFLLDALAEYLLLVERQTELPFPPSAVRALQYDFFCPRLPDKTTAFYWQLANETNRRWESEGRKPLLALQPEIEARGRAALEALGLPRHAWFVALHVREREPTGLRSGLNAVRNADVSAYHSAIAEIGRHGGWVVRVGDPSMTGLPSIANVIDYCHSAARADWMDVFILARCRFLMGTNSGPAFVPALYGTPVLLTNWWPAAERPWHQSDIFVPKLLRRLSDGRYLTLSETLREPFGWCYSRRHLARHCGVFVEEVAPDLIRAATVEMLERLGGNLQADADVAALRERADSIYEARKIAGMARLSREFLRRYSDLIV
jgi:putative glycosyltransferase (TIGR04372 family)